jgi:hypothetical protein
MCFPLWPIFSVFYTWALGVELCANYMGENWGAIGEQIGNMMGTRKKRKKKIRPDPPPLLKEKKLDPSWGHPEPFHWLHELLCLKLVTFPLRPHSKRNKLDPSWGHTEPSHWVHVLLFPKLFVTIFDSR